jgi:hypothetical protein
MHVTLSGFVLFLHIAVAIASFMIAAVLHAAFHVLPRTRDVAEMRSWTALMHRLEPLLPVSALVLLGLGAWLVHLGGDEGFGFSDGWVLTAIVFLVVVEGLAGALLAPRTKALVAKVHAAADGPVPDDIRRATVDPVTWDIGHIATFGFLGVVFLMAAKPSGAWAPVFPVAGAVIGVGLSRLQLRAAAQQPGHAAEVPGQRTADDERDAVAS